jgi:hypothetical protein
LLDHPAIGVLLKPAAPRHQIDFLDLATLENIVVTHPALSFLRHYAAGYPAQPIWRPLVWGMSETYERTISGLLRKRSEMIDEMHSLRERMAVVANDIQSLDRVLQAFGYQGEMPEFEPIKSRMVIFHKSELQQHLLYQLRKAAEPMSSRDIAVSIITSEGKDRYDRRTVLDVIKRVTKAIRTLRDRGLVIGVRDPRGKYVWRIATPSPVNR